ncbi:MAG: glycosyltransferase family 39 protein [Dehalococcoidia bacterium]|nr:MAG: glycosyltransferase family 39 protein [Dehalococcoidia bacterium]
MAAMAAIGLVLGATWPAITADEGTTLSTAKAAVSGMHQWIEMLAPPIQVALYAPFFSIGHPELATVVPALFGALVLMLIVAVAWRITGMPWAGAIAGLFLLSSPEYWQRSSNLVAYQPFVFFGYLGLVLMASACRDPRRSRAFAIAGGIALAVSVYSFTTGLLFLPAAILLALAWKVRRGPALLSLAVTAVLVLPFAVWHVAAAGVRNAWFYPHNFLLLDYSEEFQAFLSRPDYDLVGYVTGALPEMLLGAAPIWLWILAGAGLLVIGKVYGARVSATIAAAMVAALIPFIVAAQPPHARYGYVLVPVVALVAGIGLALGVKLLAQQQARRHLAVLATLVLALLAVFTASAAMLTHLDNVRIARATPQYVDLEAVAGKIDDDRAVLARTSYLQVLLPDNQVYTHLFFSEAEYLDYILWQDEERVRQLFAERDIGWVVFQKNVHTWERDFNYWAFDATGSPPLHYICLPQSAGFSEVYDGRFFALYEVRQDWLQSESVSGACTVPQCELWAFPGAWREESGPPNGESYCESP